MSGIAARGSQIAGGESPDQDTGSEPDAPLDLSERLAARLAAYAERHPVLARRWAVARTVLLWLSIPAVIAAWIAVPNGGQTLAVLIGLFWLSLQGWVLGRSKSLSWRGYARTFRFVALVAPAIAGLEIAIGALCGWSAGDEAPTVALAGPVEETLKLLPLLVVFAFARNRWRRLGAVDFILLGLAGGAGFQFAEDTIRRLVATAQPQIGLFGLLASLHGTNSTATDYGFFQLFPGGNELGRLTIDGTLSGATVFPGHAVLTAMVAGGIGLAIRGRRRWGKPVWILPVLLWLAAIANHMAANFATYGGPVPGSLTCRFRAS